MRMAKQKWDSYWNCAYIVIKGPRFARAKSKRLRKKYAGKSKAQSLAEAAAAIMDAEIVRSLTGEGRE